MKMSRRIATFTAAMLAGALLVSPAMAEESKKDAKRAGSVGGVKDSKDGGVVTGTVFYEGKTRKRAVVTDLMNNAWCAGTHKGEAAPLKETYIFGKNGDKNILTDAFVYVSKGLEGKKFDPPKTPAKLDQKGCIYTPHVIGVVVNQKIDIYNSDNTLHNVQANPIKNKAFNVGMPVPMKMTKSFDKVEADVRVSCAVHPWMDAYIHVMPHPFFAVTDEKGNFEIHGLPPGEYELMVVHQITTFRATPVKVTVEQGKTAKGDLTLAYKKGEARPRGDF